MNAEEIVRQYDFEIVLRRWLATVIDLVTLYLCLLGTALLGSVLLGPSPPANETTAIICVGVLAAYFPVLEGWTGFTVGKFLLRIRVVNIDGKAPGFVRALLRTLIRLIEVNPILLGGLPAGIIVLCSKKKQRLGDMLAHTYVIKTRDLVALP